MLVSGTGIPPQRQQQIHGLLDRLPHVVVRFDDPAFPAGAMPVQSEPATRDAAGPEKSTYAARIEERLGGRPQFERFSSSVLDWTDSAMTRAYALRRLAQQFSAAAENQMTAEDRRTLRKLGREHLAAFAKDAQRVANTVNPVLTGMGAGRRSSKPAPSRPPGSPPVKTCWPPRAARKPCWPSSSAWRPRRTPPATRPRNCSPPWRNSPAAPNSASACSPTANRTFPANFDRPYPAIPLSSVVRLSNRQRE